MSIQRENCHVLCMVIFKIVMNRYQKIIVLSFGTDYESNRVYAADSLPMTLISNTNLHRGLVMGVSAVMPVGLLGTTLVLNKKRGKSKQR